MSVHKILGKLPLRWLKELRAVFGPAEHPDCEGRCWRLSIPWQSPASREVRLQNPKSPSQSQTWRFKLEDQALSAGGSCFHRVYFLINEGNPELRFLWELSSLMMSLATN